MNIFLEIHLASKLNGFTGPSAHGVNQVSMINEKKFVYISMDVRERDLRAG